MGVLIKQSVKATLLNYVGVAIGAFNLLFLFPKVFDIQTIGLMRTLVEMGLMVAALAQLGTSNIIDKYFPYFNNRDREYHGFLFLVLTLPFFGFMIITALLFLFQDLWFSFYEKKSPEINQYFIHMLLLTLFMIYQQVLEAFSRVHYKITFPVVVREIFLKGSLTVMALLFAFKLIDKDLLIVLLVISYSFAVVLLLSYLKKMRVLYTRFLDISENKGLLKEVLMFGGVVFMSGATGVIAARIDTLMLSAYAGLASTGVYSIAFFIGTVIEIPRRSINQIAIPFLSQSWKENNIKKIGEIYRTTSVNQLLAGLLLFLLVWCNIDDIFGVMPKSEIFIAGKYVVLIIAVCRLTDMVTSVNNEIILTSSFHRINLFMALFGGVVTVSLNYYMIAVLDMGIIGAALSLMVGYILFNFIKVVLIYYKIKELPFTMAHLRLLILTIAVGLLWLLWTPTADTIFGHLLLIAMRSTWIVALYLYGAYQMKISVEFNNLVMMAWTEVKKRIKL